MHSFANLAVKKREFNRKDAKKRKVRKGLFSCRLQYIPFWVLFLRKNNQSITAMQEIEFEIDRDAVKHYFLTIWLLTCIGILVVLSPFILAILDTVWERSARPAVAVQMQTMEGKPVFTANPAARNSNPIFFFLGCMIFVAPWVATLIFVCWLCPQQAKNLRYRLEDSTLRADGGVFFLFRKSIPLERITDVALVQGPLLRFFDIWAMRIQTAGSAQCEATLWGVREPDKMRALILAQRQGVYGEKAGDKIQV